MKLPLRPRDHEVLTDLSLRKGWSRPMDVGGRDSSHHSRTLQKLCAHGLARKAKRATLMNYIGGGRGSWIYRITPKGRGYLRRLENRKEHHPARRHFGWKDSAWKSSNNGLVSKAGIVVRSPSGSSRSRKS